MVNLTPDGVDGADNTTISVLMPRLANPATAHLSVQRRRRADGGTVITCVSQAARDALAAQLD